MSNGETLLVASASGHLGRQVVETLLECGAGQVIATTRTPDRLADLARRGVEVRHADYTRPEGLVEAFRGATRLLIISTQEAGARHAQHVAALDAAKAAGVRHVLYTSHTCPDTSVSAVAPDHAATERSILASGLAYTFLRNCLYSENLLLMLPPVLESGTLYGASGEGRVAFISRRDCARAAAGALRQAALHENKIYDVTGPRTYSYQDVVDIVSDVLGRRIAYVDMAPEAYLDLLLGTGLPRVMAEAFVSFERSNALNEENILTDVVHRLTGQAPERLEDFLRDNLHKVNASQTLQSVVEKHLKT